jgi:hypothetical protein
VECLLCRIFGNNKKGCLACLRGSLFSDDPDGAQSM